MKNKKKIIGGILLFIALALISIYFFFPNTIWTGGSLAIITMIKQAQESQGATCSAITKVGIDKYEVNCGDLGIDYKCQDSDGGKDYYDRGQITLSSGQSFVDKCDGNILTEYYCITSQDTGGKMIGYTCPYKCEVGRCVEKPVCTTNSYFACYSGDSYYYNSCGERGSMKADCGTGDCTDGRCVSAPTPQPTPTPTPQPTPTPTPEPSPECSLNSDCKTSQKCVSSKCIDLECREDTDCKSTEYCTKDNTCLEKPVFKCTSATDCRSDEVCTEGKCIVKEEPKTDFFSQYGIPLIIAGVLVLVGLILLLTGNKRRK